MQKTMLAAVYHGLGDLRLEELGTPEVQTICVACYATPHLDL